MIPTSVADAIFWVALISCLVAQSAIVRSVLAGRAPSPARKTSRARRAGEVAWAVAPAFALALTLLATWRALHPEPAESETRPTVPAAEVRT